MPTSHLAWRSTRATALGSAVTFLMISAVPRANSQAVAAPRAMRPDQARTLDADARLAIRILTATVDTARTPDADAPLLRCVTPLLRRVKSSLSDLNEPLRSEVRAAIEGGNPCGAAGQFPFSITSSVRPLTVHYQSQAFATTAVQTLQFAEAAWTQEVDVMGFTAPLLNANCGADSNLDIFLQEGAGGAYVTDFASNPATSWDDYACYMVIDPNVWGGPFLGTTVWHEFNHMCQAADDWWDVGASFEATSTFIEEVADDSFNDYITTLSDFTSRPQRPFEYNDDYATFFMYGGVMELLFLRDRYFNGNPNFIADVWRDSRSPERGCYCMPELNNPDFLNAFDTVLAPLGVSYDDALLEFSRWRWFVGSNDDGNHFEEGALWPDNVRPPLFATRFFSQLPSTMNVTSAGPWSHGVVFAKVILDNPTAGALRVSFTGDASTRWSVESLSVGASPAQDWIPRLLNDGEFLVPTAGASETILKIVNRAAVDYDPDYLTTTPTPFTMTLESAPTIADLNGDGVVNGADLAALLIQWGTNGPADINADGVVNGADLAILLTNWTG